MAGPDLATPRGMGAFVMAIRPEFVDRNVFENGMRRYLAALRGSPARTDHAVLAPDDREWAQADRREAEGVPVDPQTAAEFEELAERYELTPPFREHDNA